MGVFCSRMWRNNVAGKSDHSDTPSGLVLQPSHTSDTCFLRYTENCKLTRCAACCAVFGAGRNCFCGRKTRGRRGDSVSLGLQEDMSKKQTKKKRDEGWKKGGVLECCMVKTFHCQVLKSQLNAAFFTPTPTHTHKRSDPTTLAKKSQALGKIGRLLCNQHVYNQVSALFFLFTCAAWGHLPSVLWLSRVSMGRLSAETVLSFYLAKFLWRNNGSWIKSFSNRPPEIWPK